MTTEKTIYKKLLEFQRLGIAVKKDGNNPFFKSKYTTLNEVLDKVTEPLNTLGLVIIFAPEAEGLRTSIVDSESGEKIESFMKYVGITDAQKLLACNTYFRRGSLVSLLGLSDEDNDAQNVVTPTPAPKPAPRKATPSESAHHSIDLADTVEKLDAIFYKVTASTVLTDGEKKKLIEVGSLKRDELLFEMSNVK